MLPRSASVKLITCGSMYILQATIATPPSGLKKAVKWKSEVPWKPNGNQILHNQKIKIKFFLPGAEAPSQSSLTQERQIYSSDPARRTLASCKTLFPHRSQWLVRNAHSRQPRLVPQTYSRPSSNPPIQPRSATSCWQCLACRFRQGTNSPTRPGLPRKPWTPRWKEWICWIWPQSLRKLRRERSHCRTSGPPRQPRTAQRRGRLRWCRSSFECRSDRGPEPLRRNSTRCRTQQRWDLGRDAGLRSLFPWRQWSRKCSKDSLGRNRSLARSVQSCPKDRHRFLCRRPRTWVDYGFIRNWIVECEFCFSLDQIFWVRLPNCRTRSVPQSSGTVGSIVRLHPCRWGPAWAKPFHILSSNFSG